MNRCNHWPGQKRCHWCGDLGLGGDEVERLRDMLARPLSIAEGTRINLLCACGNAMRVARTELDPPDAVRAETAHCTLCDNGGYDVTDYFDRNGEWIDADPETFAGEQR